jgi:hypothetical protein
MQNTTARYIYYIIIAALLGNVLYTIMSQLNMKSDFTEITVSAWYSKVATVSNILLTLVSIYSFVIYRRHFPRIVTVCYVVMLLLVIMGCFSSISIFLKKPTWFYSAKGIGTWINFGLLFFTAEEEYTAKIFKVFKILIYVFIAFNLGQMAIVGTISNRVEALNAVRDTTVYLIWVYPFFFFDNSDKTTWAKILKYGTLLLITFFAFVIASRSYLLFMIFFILIKLKRDLKEGRSTILIIVMVGVLMLAGYFMVANLQNLNTIKGLLNVFAGRMDDDTRSSQLKEFLDQFNYDRLFSGVGPMGTWRWSGYTKGGYEFLDNQFMLLTWWFGLQTCLVYMLFLLYPVFRRNSTKSIDITNAKIIIFFWFLACGGFAIYVTFCTALYYYFITLLIGIATLNIRKKTLLTIDPTTSSYNKTKKWERKKSGLSSA